MEKPVIIEEYTTNWALQFTEEQKIITNIIGDVTIAIEHIGSTSVAGLSAKPILDMMVGVRNFEDIDVYIEPLKTIEYGHVFHQEFPNRRFFRKGLWRAGTHHLHIYQYGSEEWNHNLLFRDYLRNHPNVRLQYEQLKKELANKHRFDRVAYTNAKAPFIVDVIQKAKNEIDV
ncbi:GrpB family protein [Bacillus cytotoxicus]|uniref:GrpB family protein n=1 Tax=Bacillus cytotoxicus TaxID=580165 RepID=A0ACC6A199_9BACI|nr:GrpB family protein [Bacillus cytotoxicus]